MRRIVEIGAGPHYIARTTGEFMFEITANDINALTDEDLRLLVAMLCQAIARGRSLPAKAVLYGGDQTAKDGGLDVRVNFAKSVKIDGFIPRPKTGFQVKKTDLGAAAITKEMRPKNKLRASIKELIEQAGAYIIVSSGAHVTDSAYKARLTAMRAAVKGAKGSKSLELDFYDRTQIATWVRDHGGVTLWVRQRIGKSVRGWRPYEPWAYAAEGVESAYLLDDKLRIKTGDKKDGDGLKPEAGLDRIRSVLREPGTVARIVGLSGVGKTRFVQALFDNRIGDGSLDPSLAMYTNMADDPDPVPVAMVSDLIATRTKAIVVVDNCPPELHRRLTETCRVAGSTVSVVTVEYDIRDDAPEGTEVFELSPSSDTLIEQFVRKRFPLVSQVDASTIANFSGGNARVAVALASTVGKKDTLAGLSDADLFKRLFQQRHENDDSLMDTAMAASLVYSFEGEDITSGPDAELWRIGGCVQQNASKMFQNVAKLFNRELVQKRSKWRAVLPHALANRLAREALQQIPYSTTEAQLLGPGAPERLVRSFSRRLGYLHDSNEAVAIVMQWLEPGGLLGTLETLSPLNREVFSNILPVVPNAALDAFVRIAAKPAGGSSLHPFTGAIRLLAWEADKFERCADLLVAIAKAGGGINNTNDAGNVLKSLFHLWLSGTHATVGQRIAVTRKLLRSGDPQDIRLGELALDALLEAHHFSSVYAHEFGAHSRDYGYQPRTNKDVEDWYKAVLELVTDIGNSTLPSADFARSALGKELRQLWGVKALRPTLKVQAKTLNDVAHWHAGWIGFRQALRFDFKKASAGRTELLAVEHILRPTDTVERVRAMLLSGRTYGITFEDTGDDDTGASMSATSFKLGKEVAANPKAYAVLLPELVSSKGQLFEFGQGLIDETNDPKRIWHELTEQYRKTPISDRSDLILRGLMSRIAEKDPELATKLIDSLVDDVDLAVLLPLMQMVLGIDQVGIDRLKKSLKTGLTPIGAYGYLEMGRASERAPAKGLREFLAALAKFEHGLRIAIEILHMRLHGDTEHKRMIDKDIRASGRELLKLLTYTGNESNLDHNLSLIVRKCLNGAEGGTAVKAICKRFKAALLIYKSNTSEFKGMLRGMVQVQPEAFLEGLLGGADAAKTVRVMDVMRFHRANVLDGIPDGALLKWCKEAPKERFAIAAAVITATEAADEDAEKQFTPLALRLIDEAPEPVKVLEVLGRRLIPRSWSGSLASVFEQNASVLTPLLGHRKKAVAAYATKLRADFDRQIASARAAELKESRQKDERFE
jgi:hypothetical protein